MRRRLAPLVHGGEDGIGIPTSAPREHHLQTRARHGAPCRVPSTASTCRFRPSPHQAIPSGVMRSANSAVRASEMKKSMSCICTASTRYSVTKVPDRTLHARRCLRQPSPIRHRHNRAETAGEGASERGVVRGSPAAEVRRMDVVLHGDAFVRQIRQIVERDHRTGGVVHDAAVPGSASAFSMTGCRSIPAGRRAPPPGARREIQPKPPGLSARRAAIGGSKGVNELEQRTLALRPARRSRRMAMRGTCRHAVSENSRPTRWARLGAWRGSCGRPQRPAKAEGPA